MPTCPCNGWNDLTDGDVSRCHYQTGAVSPSIRITCPSNARGRFVRIKRRDMLALVICEVKVHGDSLSSTRQSGNSFVYLIYPISNIPYPAKKHEVFRICSELFVSSECMVNRIL